MEGQQHQMPPRELRLKVDPWDVIMVDNMTLGMINFMHTENTYISHNDVKSIPQISIKKFLNSGKSPSYKTIPGSTIHLSICRVFKKT